MVFGTLDGYKERFFKRGNVLFGTIENIVNGFVDAINGVILRGLINHK